MIASCEAGPIAEVGGSGVRVLANRGPLLAVYPPGSTFGPRIADSSQFVWIVEGMCTWTCDGQSLRLDPGMLLLVRAGMRDSYAWAPDRPTRHGYVHFDLPTDHHSGQRDRWPPVRSVSGAGNPLGALCDYLLWLGSTGDPARFQRIEQVVSLMVAAFNEGPLPGDSETAAPAAVMAMMDAVARTWAGGVERPLPLRELAAGAGVSGRTLSRVFARHYGVGPVTALELLRLGRAAPLVSMSNLPFAAIARQAGFLDAFHFSRRFRAVYGVPPQAFRENGPGRAPTPQARHGLLPLQRLLPVTEG